nr:glycoside hydrolase family 2 TIM barrel-domain containing protein [Microbacterium bovistercoris]
MIRRPLLGSWTVEPKRGVFEAAPDGAGPVAVTLPHDALRDLPRAAEHGVHSGYIPGGVFEYRRVLDIPEAWRDRVVAIEFEGVYRDAAVYLNGALAGRHTNGYTGFTVDADAFLRFGGPNVLTVEARAHGDSRWYTGAGIYRPVHLVVADPVHIPLAGVAVTTPDVDAERAIVQVATDVVNRTRHTALARLRWQVLDAADREVAAGTSPITVLPGERATARARLTVTDPALWSSAHPALYTVRTQLAIDGRVVDDDATTFGIRTLQLDRQHGLRINGESVTLRGACIHHDGGPLGAAATAQVEDRRVRLLKDAGFNAVRSAHNPASRALLDACDRHGVLVMDELSDVWTRAKTPFDHSLAFPDTWPDDVARIVTADRNHPSVILYSIGNEILELATPLGAVWGRRLAEEFRRLDPTRFVTNGINGVIANMDKLAAAIAADLDAGANTMMADMGEQMARMNASAFVSDSIEESASVLDVVGFNYADSRYRQDAADYPNRVIVGSETFPAHIDAMWALVHELPHVIGDFTWTGWDYIGEAGIGRVDYSDEPGYQPTGTAGPYPYLLAGCGDIDITGFRRPISYYREIVFGLRADPYIAVHPPADHGRPTATTPWSWNDSVASWSWDAAAGAPVTVDVYADADEVELLLDGRSLGTAPVGQRKRFIATFEVAYHPGELTAVARRAGVIIGSHTLRSAAQEVRLVVRPEADLVAPGDLVYLPITLEDAAGTVPCDHDAVVTVQVDGGELAGLASGRARTEESFAGPSCTSHDGRLLAVVRAGAVGTVQVTATADALASTTTQVVVRAR